MSMNRPLHKLFPADFLWGASTSAHQVEGGNYNQWSEWEDANAKSLAKQAEYKDTWLPRWHRFRGEALEPQNYVSGQAANHFHLYEHDFELVKNLNLNAFRFSIEWSRVQPHGPGDWNASAVNHYRRYLKTLRKRGIEPIVTLWHFTNPVWFEKRGGFAKYHNLKFLVAFADRIMRELGEDIRFVITINEPETYIYNGYRIANWPPQKQTFLQAIEVYRNLLLAHKMIYKKLKKHRRQYSISFAKTYADAYAGDTRFSSRLAAWFQTFARDTLVLYQVKHCLDFIAVNYYFADRFMGFNYQQLNKHQNDIGWNMEPERIANVLIWLHKRYKKPIMITENGLADADDIWRKWWLKETMQALVSVQQRGVWLIGYFHWALIDNFEWAMGKWPRFGLYKVDYKTMKRTMRPSARWWAAALKKLKSE